MPAGVVNSVCCARGSGRLLWNPDLDPTSLIKRFLKDYYGAAWGPIYDWMRLLQDKVDSEDIHMHLYLPGALKTALAKGSTSWDGLNRARPLT